MIKGYFPHKLPDSIPSNFGFAFVLGKIGLNTDPNFDALWTKCSRLRRGIYQRPVVTAENDAFAHASFLTELCQYHNPGWNDFPLMLNILAPNVDLTFINNWVDQVEKNLHPTMHPVLYTTLQHWADIQKGPNAEVVSKAILQRADLFLSQYKVELPTTPLYVDKLKFWEYQDGLIQYDGVGQFSKVAVHSDTTPPYAQLTPDPTDTADTTPAAAGEVTLHISCPKCGSRIF